MRNRLGKVRGLAWRLAVPAVGLAVVGQLALAGPASATHMVSTAATAHHAVKKIPVNWSRPSLIDCNGWGEHNGHDVPSARDAMKSLCTDPYKRINGQGHRFIDNGWYVGHDEPSVKFISSANGSGNTMSYGMQLSKDPATAPTATGSVTKYGELSVAPWFGLPMCDPNSYPQNACTPLSDSNTGLGAPTDAGSAFMELQFYPPGFTPFIDSTSCSTTKWCAALTIDSLSCSFNFASCNNGCIEPVNFSFLQTNGVPPGPPAPQDPNVNTFLGSAKTLKMNPGDVLKVSITDVADSGSPDVGGMKASVTDVTTGQTGYMVASAANGFANTSMADCTGTPFSFHAEYNSAQQQNQVPWAALEGGVLMEQEIGHGESCSSVSNKMGFATTYSDNTSYVDPNVYQTCNGGNEGTGKTGEGPCNLSTFICKHATTQGRYGPVACPTNDATTGQLCEFSDGFCFPKGSRSVLINGNAAKETWPVAGCTQTFSQNGDLDFDGVDYRADWPNGSSSFPTSIRYVGPFSGGSSYPQVQFETDVGGSSARCNVSTGKNCVTPPQGAKFYPFWTMTNKQKLGTLTPNAGSCTWNFGNVIANVTTNNFGKATQYGTPDVARYGGTLTSPVKPNPEFAAGCATIPAF